MFAAAERGGVVNQDVNAAIFGQSGRHHPFRIMRAAHINDNCHRLAAGGSDSPDRVMGGFPVHVGDDDLGALRREPLRGRPSQALPGPRHNCDFALQSTHSNFPPGGRPRKQQALLSVPGG